MFILLIIVAFFIGALIGMPTAPYVTPQSPTTIIIVLLPFFFLYFFSENHLINQIRYLFLSFAIGIFSYWTYSQIKSH